MSRYIIKVILIIIIMMFLFEGISCISSRKKENQTYSEDAESKMLVDSVVNRHFNVIDSFLSSGFFSIKSLEETERFFKEIADYSFENNERIIDGIYRITRIDYNNLKKWYFDNRDSLYYDSSSNEVKLINSEK